MPSWSIVNLSIIFNGVVIHFQHINIFFYYLRKMLKYGKVKNEITTTDDMFDQRLRAVYPMFKDPNFEDNAGLFSPDSMISEYICGKSLRAGRPWSLVDEVLMPYQRALDYGSFEYKG